MRYDQNKATQCNNGNWVFWHHEPRTGDKTCAILSQEYIEVVSLNQSIINIEIWIS